MTYECRGCGLRDDVGGSLGRVYPRIVFNRCSEVLCDSCKERLEGFLNDQWRKWFIMQVHVSDSPRGAT
jgi:hypothetical protein